MPSVYIVGGNGGGYGQMFISAGWDLAKGPVFADLIQFTGGEDITPSLYGEEKHKYTGNSFERDLYEAGYFAIAKRMGIPMAGICRGGQFLNVMSGGKMYQHVEKHAVAEGHWLFDFLTGRNIKVSSTHHQMMRAGEGGDVVAHAVLGGFKQYMEGGEVIEQQGKERDTEAVYYEADKTLCFQPHPEFFEPGHECFDYYFELIERYHGLRA